MKNLKINPNLTIKKIIIPGTSLHAYIIDNFLLNTDSVMNFAHNLAYFNPMFSDNSFYPGIRDNMPLPYKNLLKAFFDTKILPEILNRDDINSTFHKCLLSLITCQPSKLIYDQKVPHIDSCDSRDYAFVHYLSDEELGGTSIYKYKPKNLIEFNEEHKSVLSEITSEVEKCLEEHQGYITGTTSLFEQTLNINAQFNRLVIYQGNLLHSANIISAESYCSDPKKGRLSIASFASIRTN